MEIYESHSPDVTPDVTPDVAPDPTPRALDRLVHLLSPCPCLGCGVPLPGRRTPLLLCAGCRAALPSAAIDPDAACPTCGRAVSRAAAGSPCGACRLRRPSFDRLIAPWRDAPPLAPVLRAFKFRRLDHLGEGLAELLAAAAGPRLAGCDGLVPVPLHWRRRLARGYDQVAEIARPLGRRLGLPVVDALRRRRPTAPQTDLGRAERQRNLRDAFAARRCGRIAGRRLAVLDDIATTGATLDAAAAALRAAGAREVIAVAVALREATAGV